PPRERVDAMLLVALPKAREQHLLSARLAAVVLDEKDLRGAGHEDAAAPRQHAGRKAEVVEERGRLVVLAVALRAFEEFNLAAEFALAVGAERVVAHLDDPQLAVRRERERDGVLDLWLRGH